MANVLKIGIPKGSLQESTLALFSAAGFSFRGSERSLRLSSNDPEIEPVLLRPQEIPVFVSRGDLDCGLAGWDWILESRSMWFDRNKQGYVGDLHILADLQYSKQSFRPVRWVLAVPEDSPCHKTEDLKTLRAPVRVSTELKYLTENWLSTRGIFAEVDFSWGATEAKAGKFANAIVECTETGASLQANRLRILDDVLVSTTRFFAHKPICIEPKAILEEDPSREELEKFRKDMETYKSKESDWKRPKLAGIALLLKSCLGADAKVNIRVFAPSLKAEVLEALIPSSVSYSVWNGKKDEVLFDLIVDKASVRDLVPVFARNGATQIIGSKLDMVYE